MAIHTQSTREPKEKYMDRKERLEKRREDLRNQNKTMTLGEIGDSLQQAGNTTQELFNLAYDVAASNKHVQQYSKEAHEKLSPIYEAFYNATRLDFSGLSNLFNPPDKPKGNKKTSRGERYAKSKSDEIGRLKHEEKEQLKADKREEKKRKRRSSAEIAERRAEMERKSMTEGLDDVE
jgi:hypothetical protein